MWLPFHQGGSSAYHVARGDAMIFRCAGGTLLHGYAWICVTGLYDDVEEKIRMSR